ncbi:YihY/virulence factor BrkB family protein [Streptacidiphilus carbonis]|uniref:YihY/virulence factor BrkB family protein n=1 Tax=Streptacidiphilus carbonis TaxID=105422 RepID=UPI0005A6E0D2|nr:YihY/virulence factor BrkB family protein [Streptacidiphilus carbonis]
MDWLTRLPVVGPLVAWVLRSRAYLAFEHFNEAGSNRMAGAVTFFGFLALFPLLTVAMAIAAATLSSGRVADIQSAVARQIPSLSQSLDLDSLVRNAGTVGGISGTLLLVSGLGWVDTTRVSIRTVWRLPVEPGNAVLRKALDVGVLIGLGAVAAVSIAASAATSALAGQLASWFGVDSASWGRALLSAASFLIAVGADTLMFAYLLVGLPRIGDQRKRAVVEGALLGAVGFELLKQLLSAYLSNVAAKSMYGAFGTPVALLLWINFIFRWLFFCVAWTATDDPDAARARARDRAAEAWTEAGGSGSPTVPPEAPSAAPAVEHRSPRRALAFLAGTAFGSLATRCLNRLRRRQV